MHLLFICNQGMHRSRTAAELFSNDHVTDYAGVYGNLLREEQLRAADIVFVMEEHQRRFIAEQFPHLYLKKQILLLDIPDIYGYEQQELRELLKERIRPLVELH